MQKFFFLFFFFSFVCNVLYTIIHSNSLVWFSLQGKLNLLNKLLMCMYSCYFRGYQLHNPFYTIWATKLGSKLAVSFHNHNMTKDEPFFFFWGGEWAIFKGVIFFFSLLLGCAWYFWVAIACARTFSTSKIRTVKHMSDFFHMAPLTRSFFSSGILLCMNIFWKLSSPLEKIMVRPQLGES